MFSKRTLQATLLYTLLGFLPLVSGVVLLPINLRYMSPADYGTVAQATVMVAYLQLLLTFGLEGAVLRFYLDFKTSTKRMHYYLSHLLGLMLLLSLGAALLYSLVGSWVLDVVWNKQLDFGAFGWPIFAITFFSALNLLLQQYYRAADNLRMVAIIAIVPFVLSTCASLVAIIALQWGGWGQLLGRAVGLGLASVPLYIWLIARVGLHLRAYLVWPLLRFSLPIFLYGVVGVVAQSIDKVVLSQLFSLADLGRYNLALTVVLPIGIAQMAYMNAISPQVLPLLSPAANALAERQLLRRHHVLMFMGTTLLIWLAIGLVGPVVHVLAREAYWVAIQYVPLLAVGLLGRAAYVMYTQQVFYDKDTHYLTIASIVSVLITIALTYVLGRTLGLLGICMATSLYQYVLTATVVALYWSRFRYCYAPSAFAFWLLPTAGLLLLNYLWLYPSLPAWHYHINAVEMLAIMLFLAWRYWHIIGPAWQQLRSRLARTRAA